ncbi:MAG: DNA recombination protein RmuC, partial [Aquamicrobium sp.]|nr:DNA recombination protein RmuC [Aquamicrobium sp.]
MDDLSSLFSLPVAQLGASVVTLGHALAAAGGLVLAVVFLLALALWRAGRA